MPHEILLTQGKLALIDDEDVSLLSAYRWRVNSKGYAIRSFYRSGKEIVLCMHRLIVNAQRGEYVDHISGDKLDNRKVNLRLCTQSQNLANRGLFKNSTTGFMGVRFEHSQWRAHLQINKRILFLGTYDDLKTAAQVRDHAATLLYGEFARPNLPCDPASPELRQRTEQRLIDYGYSIPVTE